MCAEADYEKEPFVINSYKKCIQTKTKQRFNTNNYL